MTENNNNNNILIDTSSRASNSYFSCEKLQSNNLSSYNSDFNKSTLYCFNGQVIRYWIFINCFSPFNLYNIKVKDQLDTNLSYIPGTFYTTVFLSSLYNSYGTVKFNPTGSTVIDGKTVGGTIEWNIPELSGPSNTTAPSRVGLYFDSEVVYNIP